jgi:hypothetical protein
MKGIAFISNKTPNALKQGSTHTSGEIKLYVLRFGTITNGSLK